MNLFFLSRLFCIVGGAVCGMSDASRTGAPMWQGLVIGLVVGLAACLLVALLGARLPARSGSAPSTARQWSVMSLLLAAPVLSIVATDWIVGFITHGLP